MFEDTASALFGVEGLQVTGVEAAPDGGIEVWVVTDCQAAAACPDSGTLSHRVHETVVTRPRDVRRAGDAVDLHWVKLRRKCANGECPRKTFTEWVPGLPPRCRITARLREQAAHEVAERGIIPAEAARHAGISWPVAHGAFAPAADPVLGQPASPVAHPGIDEHRRGRARFAVDERTGEYTVLADRRHTCFFDLDGQQGLLGQVEGRTADDAAYWLAGATPAWRDAVRVVCIDLCSIYASAVRRMLPHATLTVDLFHVVQLAVKAVGDVRRRVVRARYGRRGRCGDPEYGIKGLLVRNLENLSSAQFTKILDTLDRDRYGQEIAAAWIGKEKLRDALNLRARVTGSVPCERQVRDRLFSFYDWCAQHDDIPELVTLAKTVSRWEDEIAAALITGVTNATSESLNRLAKLEARLAYGFRNPRNQRRRVRIACTRGYRTKTRSRLTSKAHIMAVRAFHFSGVEERWPQHAVVITVGRPKILWLLRLNGNPRWRLWRILHNRHSTALHLLQAGVELNVIKSWLGHASITTTSQYVEIDMAMKRKAIERCPAPVPTPEGESPWHARQDIIQWLEDLSTPKSHVKHNPWRPTSSNQTTTAALLSST